MKINIKALSASAALPFSASIISREAVNFFMREDCPADIKQTFKECVDEAEESIKVIKDAISGVILN